MFRKVWCISGRPRIVKDSDPPKALGPLRWSPRSEKAHIRSRKESNGINEAAASQMPSGGSDEDEEVVFLSPDESPPKKDTDQGASPQLRRSNRNRKSVTVFQDMTKGQGSGKKKKCSPNKNKTSPEMPKVARTPQKGQADPQGGEEKADDKAANGPEGFAAMLLAMEARLSSKLDANKKAVNEAVKMSKLNSDTLDALE